MLELGLIAVRCCVIVFVFVLIAVRLLVRRMGGCGPSPDGAWCACLCASRQEAERAKAKGEVPDHYALIGVPYDAASGLIKKVYYRKPDKIRARFSHTFSLGMLLLAA